MSEQIIMVALMVATAINMSALIHANYAEKERGRIKMSLQGDIAEEYLVLSIFKKIKEEMMVFSRMDQGRFRESLLRIACTASEAMDSDSEEVYEKLTELRNLAE